LATYWGNEGLHVFALDLRNHGKSPHTEAHSIKLMTDDLQAFMQQHQLAKASILGHSMGGKVAMQFALSFPHLVERLIVADMAPRAYIAGAHDDVFNAINHVDLGKAQTRKQVEEAMAVYLGDAGTRQFIMKSLERIDESHYKWKFNNETLQRDYAHILQETTTAKSFDGSVLFLKGALSLYIQEKDLPLISRLFPLYQLVSIEKAGHWLHADQPKIFGDTVLAFMRNGLTF
jgi:esterase